MAVIRRLRIDPVACDAFGHCAELAPELVWLDEWGYPVLDDRPVAVHEVELARSAVRACPRRALLLEEVPDPAPAARQTRAARQVIGRR